MIRRAILGVREGSLKCVSAGQSCGLLSANSGELTAKLNFAVAGASKGAIEAVEKAGGKVELPEAKEVPTDGKKAQRKAAAAAKRV